MCPTNAPLANGFRQKMFRRARLESFTRQKKKALKRKSASTLENNA
jgi:hypothetical protein